MYNKWQYVNLNNNYRANNICKHENLTWGNFYFFFHVCKWHLSDNCCLSEHIVTYYTWFVILRLSRIFCYCSRVCILITDFSRAGNDTGNVIFFTFTSGIYHLFVVLVNILLHTIHDMLSSHSYASIATTLMSVS